MIGFTDVFVAQSLLITINYENSHSIYCRGPAPFSFSLILQLSQLNYTDSYILSARTTHRKHSSSIVACMSVGFPRDRYPASPLARCLLPRNGLGANHIENTAPVLLAVCLFERVYLATGFSGSIA
jgi:hypothetical protein